jgi:3-hydroxyacyl-[acyl-carrier-protein] dehydratase
MLRDSFYTILQSNQDVYTIRFNASHPIFSGHFPEHPIVPGACVVQIAEELAALTYEQPIRFTSIRDLKFRQPITPNQEIIISIKKITESVYKVQCIDPKQESQLIISLNITII